MGGTMKYPRRLALDVAREIIDAMRGTYDELVIAGSLRRRREEVGDVEIVFVPRMEAVERRDFFSPPPEVSLADVAIQGMLSGGMIRQRLNVLGRPAWGAANKLAVHVESGVPVDFFGTTAAAWWGYVVCRTGGARTNVAICEAARRRGWKWCPTTGVFSRASGLGVETHAIGSEREVFEFVEMEYREPRDRE